MMKPILIILFCFVSIKVFSQESQVLVEEKSSSWIKVTGSSAESKPAQASVKKKTSKKPTTPKPEGQQDFDKTNKEVNRFKKTKNQ